MINYVEQLRSLIIWCREHSVKSLKLPNVEFELSEIAFLPPSDSSQLPVDEKSKNLKDLSEEELLFLSST